MRAEDVLRDGITILDPFMNDIGFIFTLIKSGQSSGGNYACGKYIKGDRYIELNYRYSLGLVNYNIRDKKLFHDDYMKLLGVYGKNSYPGFSDNPLDGFKHLLHDLQHFASDFLNGDGKQFIELAAKFEQNPNMFKIFGI